MRMNDFTLNKYKELCLALLDAGYVPYTVLSYLESGDKDESIENIVIIRHDVDRKPLHALKMAELENSLGIRATYYFRYPYTFRPEIIKKIQSLGHEVGYHYEVLSKAKGDRKKAIELFKKELDEFRKIADVKTICMHGSPLSRYDNRDLWKYYNFRDFGIVGEAYLSITNVSYFSDTGRSWNWKKKIRDYISGNMTFNSINTTEDLIRLIKSKKFNKLYILVHPERWALNKSDWISSYMRDLVFNIGKTVLKKVMVY